MPALYLKTDWPIPHPFQIIEEVDLVASWESGLNVPYKYLNLIFGVHFKSSDITDKLLVLFPLNWYMLWAKTKLKLPLKMIKVK